MFNKETWYTSTDVMKTCDYSGSYYFSENIMSFFASRLLCGFWPTKQDRTQGLVVVSNRDRVGGGAREYNVVEFTQYLNKAGRVKVEDTHLETFPDARRAKAWAMRAASECLKGEAGLDVEMSN